MGRCCHAQNGHDLGLGCDRSRAQMRGQSSRGDDDADVLFRLPSQSRRDSREETAGKKRTGCLRQLQKVSFTVLYFFCQIKLSILLRDGHLRAQPGGVLISIEHGVQLMNGIVLFFTETHQMSRCL